MATYPPSRANLESRGTREVAYCHRNSSTTSTGRAISRVTHARDITSHTHIARASSSLGAFTSPVTPREERSERYKRAEWIAATQGAAVGCGGWTDKAELERRDVEDAMLIYASTTVMRATSRARQASRRSPESTARKPSFALLRFYLYRTQIQVCAHTSWPRRDARSERYYRAPRARLAPDSLAPAYQKCFQKPASKKTIKISNRFPVETLKLKTLASSAGSPSFARAND